ncbi:hypothetical protein V6N13_108141 [Hibiscus sabdariffa]|uniref:Uncharacterized protein n=1 Tax=Hibiscus sabdariffa TaxID=183260 RepID=A0ABR2SRC6_9ROSI
MREEVFEGSGTYAIAIETFLQGDVRRNRTSNSSLSNAPFANSSNFLPSSKVSLDRIDDGVLIGLVRRLELPDRPGDVADRDLVGVACAGSLSDGPISRCTISWKVLESVCTNVVKGLQVVAAWLAGFSIVTCSL